MLISCIYQKYYDDDTFLGEIKCDYDLSFMPTKLLELLTFLVKQKQKQNIIGCLIISDSNYHKSSKQYYRKKILEGLFETRSIGE